MRGSGRRGKETKTRTGKIEGDEQIIGAGNFKNKGGQKRKKEATHAMIKCKKKNAGPWSRAVFYKHLPTQETALDTARRLLAQKKKIPLNTTL